MSRSLRQRPAPATPAALLSIVAILAWTGGLAGCAHAEGEGPGVVAGPAVSMSAGAVDGDVAVELAPRLGVETVPFGLWLHAPLTLRLADLPPPPRPGPAPCGVVRCEEWTRGGRPDPAAALRLVEDVRVMQSDDAFFARGGRLYATLGRGALVSGYTNAAAWDERSFGAWATAAARVPGLPRVEALVGDVLEPTRLFGARVAARPLAPGNATGEEPAHERLAVAIELAGDAAAPEGHASAAFGALPPGARSRPLVGAAVDVGWPVFDSGAYGLEPWAAASGLTGLRSAPGLAPTQGFGGAAGVTASLDAIFLALRVSGELSIDGPGHRRGPFALTWDVDRRRVLRRDGSFAEVGSAELVAPGGLGGGGGLEVVILRLLRGSASLHLDPVAEASHIDASLSLDAEVFQLAARWQRRSVVSASDAAALGDGTFVALESRLALWSPLAVVGRWRRAPRFDAEGLPRASDDVLVGLEVAAAFEAL